MRSFNANSNRGRALLSLIRLAPDAEAADRVIESKCGIIDLQEKLNFLNHFDIVSLGDGADKGTTLTEDEHLRSTYYSRLTAVVDKKWG